MGIQVIFQGFVCFAIINTLKLLAICIGYIGVFVRMVEFPRNRLSGPENVYVLNF